MSLAINWPHSYEAEQGLLGCVLHDGALAGGLDESLFHDLKHQAIARLLKQMANEGQPIDALTAAQRVSQAPNSKELGGMAYVSELPEKTSTALQWDHWLGILEQKAVLRRVIHAGWDGFTQAQKAGIEPEEVVEAFERRALELRPKTGRETVDNRATIMEIVEELEAAHTNPGKLQGIATGYPDLDRMLSGMRPGQMIVLAARPSVGKTSLAMNIAEKVAVDDKTPVLVFSLEMSGKELLHRLNCCRARVDSTAAYRGQLTDGDFRRLTTAQSQIARSCLAINDESGISVGKLASLARRIKAKSGTKLIIVDYLSLLNTGDKRRGLYEDVSFISNALKSVAKELGIPMLVLAQLNRDVEKGDRKPRLSDLRDSGSIEQDADVVAFLHRDGECQGGVQPVELIVAKQRNGPTGKVDLQFHRSFTRFESVTNQPSTFGID